MTNNTLLPTDQLQALTSHGEAFLLVTYEDGMEETHRYTANELVEVFTPEQLAALATGDVAIQKLPHTGELARWVNMLGAARARMEIGRD